MQWGMLGFPKKSNSKNADGEILALESYNRTLLKHKGLGQVTVDENW